MRNQTSTPRPHRTITIAVKTVDIFTQKRPEAHIDLGYAISHPRPLPDPCAYAATVSGPKAAGDPAQRIAVVLRPSASETEALRTSKPSKRSTAGDPAFRLAGLHDLTALKQSMRVSGVPVDQYHARHSRRSASSSAETSLTGIAPLTAKQTPLRRINDAPSSAIKRARTSAYSPSVVNTSLASGDGDVSLDTMRSVLRLVDESLLHTPERVAAATPRVVRAQAVPSPRERGPAFAYDGEALLQPAGGLASRLQPAPFGFARVI